MKCICLTKRYYWGKIIEKLVNNKEIIMAYTDDMKVEQFVNTSCGKNGEFDTAFMSAGVLKDDLYPTSTRSMKANKTPADLYDYYLHVDPEERDNDGNAPYDPVYSYERRLKEGAVKKRQGFFGLGGMDYNDSDYEDVRVQTHCGFHVLEENTQESILSKETTFHYNDYRENPQDAPYRMAWSKTADGRLVVMRGSYLGRVYSTGEDKRWGNYMAHCFIFPAGVEIDDVDVSKLPWMYGLDKKYWVSGIPQEDSILPTLTMGELKKERASENEAPSNDRIDSRGDNQVGENNNNSYDAENVDIGIEISAGMSPQEVYNNLISASKHNVDVSSSFQAWVNAGGNLPEVRYLAQKAEAEAMANNEVVNSSVSNVLKLVTNTTCKFDELLKIWNIVCEKFRRIVNASESEREKLINERNQLYNDLLAKLDMCDLEKVFDFAKSSDKYYTAKIAMAQNDGSPIGYIKDMQDVNRGFGKLLNFRMKRERTA